ALISRPRSARSLALPAVKRFSPAYSTRLAGSTTAFSGKSRRIDIAETVLPLPDSPTSASVESSRTWKLTPRTASTLVCRVAKETRKLETLTSARIVTLAQLRIERVAQAVGEHREGGEEDRHEHGGGGELPPLADDELGLRFRQHGAPGHHVDRHAQAEEGEDHLDLDERHHQERELHQDHVAHVRQDVH